MLTLAFLAAGIALCVPLAYHRCGWRPWLAAWMAYLLVASSVAGLGFGLLLCWGLFAAAAVLLRPGPLRRRYLAAPLLARFRRVLPRISRSEREALEAGTVWWDGEFLGGRPDWQAMFALRPSRLTDEERAFLEGPVEALCEMIDEWRVTHELHDLPPQAWAHIRGKGYFGLIIPRAYGGLGFSAAAHSEVIMKLTSRSATAAVTVMVPNSLGPAELLLVYGTQAQKDHYLPRLARGEEIPCFALTSPEAGSDAAAIPDYGIVCRGEWEGRRDVLGMRLTWEKRYITLAPVATLLGLAFRLYDPDRLLGPEHEVGITLALIPVDTPGVHIGRRHLAMDAAFMNGPTWGHEVFVPMSCVVGGADRAGQGWAMLMNCLAAGRSISLPANSCGVAKLCAATAGAYARVRRQFGLPLGRFEGVEAVLARIAGNTYVMEAARRTTAAAIDAGEKPSVISAIVKHQLTERARRVVNDAMDVHAGKAICTGPGNYLALAYQQVPIAITVEGANILTRSMIIFGQGLVRGHPYLLREIAAGEESDRARAVREFDAALFGHAGFFASNAARAWWLAVTRGRWAGGMPGDALTRPAYAQLTRHAAALAFVADVALIAVGGALKRKERLSARLADVLSLLYLGACVLKRHEDQGRPPEDEALVRWAMTDTLRRIEHAFHAVFDNLRPAWLAALARAVVFPPGVPRTERSDRLDHEAAQTLLARGPARQRLVAGLFVSRSPQDALATLEAAFEAVILSEPVEARMREALGPREHAGDDEGRLAQALAAGAISEEEAELVRRAAALRRAAIMVDDFPRDLGATDTYRTTQAVRQAAPPQPREN